MSSAAAGRLFVIAAPSGAGKSTLIRHLLDTADGLEFSISWTTRSPRAGEQHGREYNFTDEAGFVRMIDAGAFLEWAHVHGRRYGTARADVEALLAHGRDVVLDIDVQGAAQLRDQMVRSTGDALDATFVFVLPPDAATLERRLRARATDADDVIATRLANAAIEVEQFESFDYVIVNDRLEQAKSELVAIVTAARARVDRRLARARRIVASFAAARQDQGHDSA